MNKAIGYRKLYTAANKLMEKVGCDGELEINTMDDYVGSIMDALYEIDGGCCDDMQYGFVSTQSDEQL